MELSGVRRLHSLVAMLPFESATATIARAAAPEPGRREQGVGSWEGLARLLSSAPAMQKRRGMR